MSVKGVKNVYRFGIMLSVFCDRVFENTTALKFKPKGQTGLREFFLGVHQM